MTAKAALCYHLLRGDVLTVGSGFDLIGLTNISREIGRSIERIKDGGFGVKVSKARMDGENRHGNHCTWNEYRLNRTAYNADGIEKMKKYLISKCKGHKNEKKYLKVCQPV